VPRGCEAATCSVFVDFESVTGVGDALLYGTKLTRLLEAPQRVIA